MQIIHEHAAGYRFTQDLIATPAPTVVSLKLLPTVFVRRLIIYFPMVKTVAKRGPSSTIYLWPEALMSFRRSSDYFQVPGRKTDVKDCQWIQQLHSYGLFNRCFVAEGDQKESKYLRLRVIFYRPPACISTISL